MLQVGGSFEPISKTSSQIKEKKRNLKDDPFKLEEKAIRS
jgi:hypothetical protein